jgi:hypothetical protein
MVLAMIKLMTPRPKITPAARRAVEAREGPGFGVMTEVTTCGEGERGRAFFRMSKQDEKMERMPETPLELEIELVACGINSPQKDNDIARKS